MEQIETGGIMLQIRNSRDIKYFAYISDAKLKMLYGQLDRLPSDKKIEWKIDIKFASFSSGTQQSEGNITREGKLAEVLKALEDRGQIGTVDEPLEYFRGTIPMRWGIFHDQGRPEDEPPLVYFGAYVGHTILGLGGSTRHVVGMQGMTSTGSRSVTPYLVEYLLAGLGVPNEGWEAHPSYDDSEQHTYEAIVLATSQLRGPTQEMEFVAKTLLKGPVRHPIVTRGERRTCLLGTPLYVAFGRSVHIPDPWQSPWTGEPETSQEPVDGC